MSEPATGADADLAALDAVRARISAHVDATQGAFHRRGALDRLWPIIAAALAAVGVVGWGLSAGPVAVSVVVGVIASALALLAVGLAPSQPARSELCARAALAIGCLALIAEIGLSVFSAHPIPGNDVACASWISGLALPPLVLALLYLRRAATPARLLHVCALASGAFLASGAAVWAECPGDALDHVMASHVLAPVIVAVLLVVALRPTVRGATLPKA